ncbi:GAP family protein [Glaciihabitans sp. dw_435]|uniref:GAP family protein n=1 Tax=Glaciihabitans sp. dw_435 TaxID=2720081 RepID=UPI001BD5E15C|nr:GAP family protein [Glaciihabitans sp. dw_435]
MNGAIGDVLPLALGVAISPVPIIAAILMLLSRRARGTSLGFLLGWTLGVVVVVTIAILVSGVAAGGSASASPVVGIIKIVLGVLLVLLAIGQWRKRPHGDTAPVMPKWMAAIDSMTPMKAAGLGFILAAINPKNLMLTIAAGVGIGSAGLSGGQQVAVAAVFVVVSIITIAAPVAGFLVTGDRLRGALDELRTWLTANNAVIMSVLLLVLGVVNIGHGIGAL